MTLNEILTDKDRLKMAYRYLVKVGFNATLGSLWVRVNGAGFSVHVYPLEDDMWMVVWYKSGKRMNVENGIPFEEAVKSIEPLLPSKAEA